MERSIVSCGVLLISYPNTSKPHIPSQTSKAQRSKSGRSSGYSPVIPIDSGQLGCEETENLNASSKGTMLSVSSIFRGSKRSFEIRVAGIRWLKGWQFLLVGRVFFFAVDF
ncbi:hypothetical protein PGT21_032028 [Puccinia graminis f. sp. tritici]|uniref:Uncharacterized protein n=1 Tax=Puccinia graminis f. sp. tritici TaxID=56615 RepID=A0A5B0QCE5_PUCGR|nr:hypothetical protein PGT21_032028 [Puccinia graminis f. sp. tritici]KAA1139139.1 hypothetical protein PGTUg99_036540 [Puccinia graminis f. sp. tritici]